MNHHDRVTLQRPGCVGSPLDLQGRSRPRYRTLSRCSLHPRLSTASNSHALSPPPACRASTSPTLKTYGPSQHGSYWSKRIRHSYSSIDKHWRAITRVSRTKAGRACTYVRFSTPTWFDSQFGSESTGLVHKLSGTSSMASVSSTSYF